MSEIDSSRQEGSIPFYPDHVSTEIKVTIGVLAVFVFVGILGLINPVGLGEPADPLNTPEHVKPEWYFLALYQLLKFIPKTTGAVAPVVAVILVAMLPFIARKKDVSPKSYKYRLILVAVGLVIFIAMTIWGEVS